MIFETIRHKALRRFAETGNTRGLPAGVTDRLRNMLAYLSAIEAAKEFVVPPNFGAHLLKGDRAGTWALTVTKNWRMTFRLDDAGAIVDMDLEDYH
ncbi:MAG: type II toxin-antitoxin system RelE/ParE family toxin [Pseudomonadota bacterium]